MMLVSEFRRRLEVSGTRLDDEAIDYTLDGVSADFERETGLLWRQVSGYVEEITPRRGGVMTRLYLGRRPVTAITSLEEKLSDHSWNATDPSYYAIIKGRSVERVYGFFSARGVRVTYDAGWAPSAVPDDVKNALVIQARFLLERTRDSKIDLRATLVKGGGNILMDASMHPIFARVVKAYRRL